ncbi:MAG: response regulator transcription factor [Bacteroidota bacterium]
MKSKQIKVAIADDHPIVRLGLRVFLDNLQSPACSIKGEFSNGADLMDFVSKQEVDLIVLDLNMPKMDGITTLGKINELSKPPKLIVYSVYHDNKIVKAAFNLGIDAYILKQRPIEELAEGIEQIFSGKMHSSKRLGKIPRSAIQESLVEGLLSAKDDRYLSKHRLTKRELEILRLIAQAMSNKEIGKQLFISDQTVSVHRKNIMRKLGVSNTAGLIKAAYEHQLI